MLSFMVWQTYNERLINRAIDSSRRDHAVLTSVGGVGSGVNAHELSAKNQRNDFLLGYDKVREPPRIPALLGASLAVSHLY